MGLPVKETQEEKMSAAISEREMPSKLNAKNWLNLAFFVLNAVFTYGVGNAGWFGGSSNGDLSRKYQTLVTPSSRAFSIWALIFLLQGVFAVVQLLPRFRAKPMVQDGVSYCYVLTCTFQVAWSFAFAFEVIWLSLVFIILIWISLCVLLYSQYYAESDNTLSEFWLLRFPFALHCGWLTAASVLNVNVVAVDASAAADVQLAVAIVSLAYLHAVSVWVLFGIRRANYTIAGVLSWAFGWIYAELQDPEPKIVATFDDSIISGVGYAAIAVSFIIVAQIIFRFGLFGAQMCQALKQSEDETHEEDAEKEHKKNKHAVKEETSDEEQGLSDAQG